MNLFDICQSSIDFKPNSTSAVQTTYSKVKMTMWVHAALIVQQSKELASLAVTRKSKRLSTIGARGSESNQKHLPSILEELVNDSHPFQKTFEENELIDFSHTHPLNCPLLKEIYKIWPLVFYIN